MDSIINLDELETKFLSLCEEDEKLLYFKYTAADNDKPDENKKAFEKYFIQPRLLRDVSIIDSSVSLLGADMPYPIGISPTAYHYLAHHHGEMATAKAAMEEDCLTIFSCLSSTTFSEIAEACPSSFRWLQMYIFKDRSLTLQLVNTAETYGYKAIVITIDSPTSGLWKRKVALDYFQKYLKFPRLLPKPVAELLDSTLEFKDLLWLKKHTRLPIVVKGVLSGEDALESVKHGASAIIVSNHGGRQIDGVVPTIEVLEEVVDAVKHIEPKVEVYLDGGVRTGSDVFRACALGARAVFIGKPIIWGLALGGEEGVRNVLQILKAEFIQTMKLAGVKNMKEFNRSLLWQKSCRCKT